MTEPTREDLEAQIADLQRQLAGARLDDAMRERVARAYEMGATDVHDEWRDSFENGTGNPPGWPDFSEAASDYADAAIRAMTNTGDDQ